MVLAGLAAVVLAAGLVLADQHRHEPSASDDGPPVAVSPARSETAPTASRRPEPPARHVAAAATGDPGSATPPATASPSPSAADSAADTAADTAAADRIADLSSSLPAGAVSVAAVDVTDGRSFTYGATSGMVEGSVAKEDIVQTLMLQHQDDGTALDDTDEDTVEAMIEHSDNDAANTLWTQEGGRDAVAAANVRLGLTSTVLGQGIYWGLSTTSAMDQLTLLRNLVGTGGPLDAASQQLILGFMDDVEPDQRWGVGVVADPGTTFANKNGWLSVDADGGLWLTNSLGVLTVGGHQVLMAVMTQHNEDFDDGIALVQAIAEAVAPAVG